MSLKCVVRAYFTHVSFFINTLNKRHDDYRHTHKIQQRKTHACNDPRIDESSSFFSLPNIALCAISFFFFFSFAFFFLDSKINFPSSTSTDAPRCCYFFLFSYIYYFFCDSNLSERFFLLRQKREKNMMTKKIFFC